MSIEDYLNRRYIAINYIKVLFVLTYCVQEDDLMFLLINFDINVSDIIDKITYKYASQDIAK